MKQKNKKWLSPLIAMVLVLTLATSCKKEADNTNTPPVDTALLPVLTTTASSNVAQTTAASGGNITSDGGSAVTTRGVCYSMTAAPTIADSKTTDGTGAGVYTSSITGLTANTTYYIRAYATNSKGTGYGAEVSFVTSGGITYGTMTDIDGNTYKTVIIGTQTWMAENLKTTKYNDGTAIPLVTDGPTWKNLTTGGYCWYNNDAASYKATYGAMYNGYAVSTGKLAPTGWHVSTDAEWNVLINYLGGGAVAASKLKEEGNIHWTSLNTDATNESGFTALPGGNRYNNSTGMFSAMGVGGTWWGNPGSASMNCNSTIVSLASSSSNFGFSVRCVKD